MNRGLAQCIVEALCATGPCQDSLTRLEKYGVDDWQRTLPWLDDTGLALYLLQQLNHSNLDRVLPHIIRDRLERNFTSNRCRVAEMKGEFHSINIRFDEAGVKYAALKGFALVPAFCPDATLRVQYDYDYFVHPHSADLAQAVLRSAGYSLKVRSPGFENAGESLYVAAPLSLPDPDQDFYSAAIARGVELHRYLWQTERDRIDLEVPENVLDRIQIANWEGSRFPVLADEDALLFQVLHTFQHILAYWCRLSCFLEIAYFIKQRHLDAAFWEQFRSLICDRKRLQKIVALVFAMSETLFGAPIPDQVRVWATPHLPRSLSLWVQRHGRTWALAPFPGSKLSILVHREFIEDPAVWWTIAWGRLFPFHRPPRVAESGGPGQAANWRAKWQQACYVLRRLQFHLRAAWGLGWELVRWSFVRSD